MAWTGIAWEFGQQGLDRHGWDRHGLDRHVGQAWLVGIARAVGQAWHVSYTIALVVLDDAHLLVMDSCTNGHSWIN